jgi:SHS family sialic acid transporter-like MFS transporter
MTGISRGQWLTLTAALLGWAFDGFEMGVFPIVSRPALHELLGSNVHEETVRQWYAVLAAAFLFGASIGGFLFGWLGDRIGRVRAMIASVLAYSLLTGACGFAQSAWQLATLRFLAALGMGGEWALGVALVVESWPAHFRPLLAGLVGAAGMVGYIAVAATAIVLPADLSWRVLLWICAAPAALTFFIRFFVPESEKWRHAAATGVKAKVADLFAPGLRHRALIGAAIGAVPLLATWGAVQFTQLWAQQLGGSERKQAGSYVQLCSAGAALIAAFLAPILLHRSSRRRSYAWLCIGALVAAEFLFLAHTSLDSRFFVAVGLTGLFSATFYGWLPLYLPELFPTRVRAAGQGFCYNAGRSLAAVGVLVTTFLIDVRGQYALASSLVCLVYIVGIVLARFIPETRGQPLPE